ncbi:hypothetical protein [Halobacillus naozhouensis]|uniref:Fur-regulated basic protein A n=1 Tax=Halobacillus naozhouensis TaxID=554880 RepID=A0ABY8J143_9BACI|nr:hypothetical protein [Halobacillus naozhouensis]WFT76217.1 hypothetical protein P9989_07595 [Halobacillus naozhouensis]
MNLSTEDQLELEVKERKRFLRNSLKRMGTTIIPDGRSIYDLSLFQLEHSYIAVTSRIAKERKNKNENVPGQQRDGLRKPD